MMSSIGIPNLATRSMMIPAAARRPSGVAGMPLFADGQANDRRASILDDGQHSWRVVFPHR